MSNSYKKYVNKQQKAIEGQTRTDSSQHKLNLETGDFLKSRSHKKRSSLPLYSRQNDVDPNATPPRRK